MAWGNPWPHKDRCTINASDISDVSGSVDDVGALGESKFSDESGPVDDDVVTFTMNSAPRLSSGTSASENYTISKKLSAAPTRKKL